MPGLQAFHKGTRFKNRRSCGIPCQPGRDAELAPGGFVKGSSQTTEGVRCAGRVVAIYIGLLGSVTSGASFAYSQSEIDPDHFDSPNTEPMPQPRAADSKVTQLRYDGTFSVPYSVLCNGKKLAPGKYSISVRFDGKVTQATLSQKGHAIEIAGVVPTDAPKQHNKRNEIVVVESNKKEPALSVARVAGFNFVFDRKLRADPSPYHKAARAEKVLLTVIVK
jgi:hypothetical protein